MKEVPGYPGVFVTKTGKVYSKTGQWNKKLRRRKGTLSMAKGYLVVGYGHAKLLYIHHLVLETYVGPRPKGMNALHRNDVKTDNRLSNLYWGTQKHNAADSRRNGRMIVGEDTCTAKLTAVQVEEIRRSRMFSPQIAKLYGITPTNVRAIRVGRSWAHLPMGKKITYAKLTADNVREIRASTEVSTVICKRFNVAPSTIKAIRRKETWKHI